MRCSKENALATALPANLIVYNRTFNGYGEIGI